MFLLEKKKWQTKNWPFLLDCLFTNLSSCLSVHLFFWQFAFLSVCGTNLLSICLLLCPSICLFTSLSVCQFSCLRICPSAYLFLCLSIHQFVSMFVCLFVQHTGHLYPSICMLLCKSVCFSPFNLYVF